MCIIVAKSRIADLPSEDDLKQCWDSNSHGAGISWMNGKQENVRLVKGLMTWNDFKKAWKKLITAGEIHEDSDVVAHFRITTHGGTSKANCHPFMVSQKVKDVQKLRTKCDMVAAHNGMLGIKPRSEEISDSMEFVMSVLAPQKNNLYLNSMGVLLNGYMDDERSRLAVLSKKGMALFGTGWEKQEETGIWYSNNGYKANNWKTYADKLYGTELAAAKWNDFDNEYYSSKVQPTMSMTLVPSGKVVNHKTLAPRLSELEAFNELATMAMKKEKVKIEEDLSPAAWDCIYEEYEDYLQLETERENREERTIYTGSDVMPGQLTIDI